MLTRLTMINPSFLKQTRNQDFYIKSNTFSYSQSANYATDKEMCLYFISYSGFLEDGYFYDIFESDFCTEFFSVTDHNFGISEIKEFILKISYESMDD